MYMQLYYDRKCKVTFCTFCRCLSSMSECLEPECTLLMSDLEVFIRSVQWNLKTFPYLIGARVYIWKTDLNSCSSVCCRICHWVLWTIFMSGVRISQSASMRWRRYEYPWVLQKAVLRALWLFQCEWCRLFKKNFFFFMNAVNIDETFVDADEQPHLEEQNCWYWRYWSRRCTQLWLQVPNTDTVFGIWIFSAVSYNFMFIIL